MQKFTGGERHPPLSHSYGVDVKEFAYEIKPSKQVCWGENLRDGGYLRSVIQTWYHMALMLALFLKLYIKGLNSMTYSAPRCQSGIKKKSALCGQYILVPFVVLFSIIYGRKDTPVTKTDDWEKSLIFCAHLNGFRNIAHKEGADHTKWRKKLDSIKYWARW